MKLICGLGNPGREYERHRHNIGFQVIDALAARTRGAFAQEKFEGELTPVTLAGEKVLLLKPLTFMNVSGRSLAPAARFYKLPPEDVLVVHDELDLPFGKLQLKAGGGSGGHNGLRSITAEGFGECARLRFGVGKPEGPNAKERVSGFVLSAFFPEETQALDGLIAEAGERCEAWVKEGLKEAMNRFNRR